MNKAKFITVVFCLIVISTKLRAQNHCVIFQTTDSAIVNFRMEYGDDIVFNSVNDTILISNKRFEELKDKMVRMARPEFLPQAPFGYGQQDYITLLIKPMWVPHYFPDNLYGTLEQLCDHGPYLFPKVKVARDSTGNIYYEK